MSRTLTPATPSWYRMSHGWWQKVSVLFANAARFIDLPKGIVQLNIGDDDDWNHLYRLLFVSSNTTLLQGKMSDDKVDMKLRLNHRSQDQGSLSCRQKPVKPWRYSVYRSCNVRKLYLNRYHRSMST